MSDCLIAAGKQIFVVRKRPLFDARASFEGDDVAGIGGKRLAIVGLVSSNQEATANQITAARTLLEYSLKFCEFNDILKLLEERDAL